MQTIAAFLHRKKVTLKELQSLIGLLNFACSIVTPGRAFSRRLIDLTHGVKNPGHYIRLSRETKEDLRLWQTFLSSFNDVSFFLDETWRNSNKLNLFTDASGSIGFGAIFGTEWCIATLLFWNSIQLSGAFACGVIICATNLFYFLLHEALVHVINKKSCRDKSLMCFVRKMVLVCLQNNIVFKAKHIAGISNKLADSLSRFQVSTFHQLAPANMNRLPTDIPLQLQPQSWQV